MELDIKNYNNILNNFPPEIRVTINEDGKISNLNINQSLLQKDIKFQLNHKPVTQLPYFLSRLSTNGSLNIEHACVAIIENMANIKNPKEIQTLRVIILELSRLLNHLDFLIKIANSLGLNTIIPELLSYKSKIKEVFESLGGSKLHYDIFKVGGFKRKFNENDIKKIESLYKFLENNIYAKLNIFESAGVRKRTENIGVYKLDSLYKSFLNGINLRSSGVQYDVRREKPYECYESLSFVIPVFNKSDCYNRLLSIICEMENSLKIVDKCLESLPKDQEFISSKVKKLEFENSIYNMDFEIPTGKLELKLHINNKNEIIDIEILTPTQKHLSIIDSFFINEDAEDLNLILASLNLDFNEICKD